MINKYTKYILWLGTAASLITLGPRIYEIYERGGLLDAIPGLFLFTLIICSPYIFMIFKLPKISYIKASQIIHLIFSLIISITGASFLYMILYESTGGISRIMETFLVVILLWVICAVAIIIESIIERRHKKVNIPEQ